MGDLNGWRRKEREEGSQTLKKVNGELLGASEGARES